MYFNFHDVGVCFINIKTFCWSCQKFRVRPALKGRTERKQLSTQHDTTLLPQHKSHHGTNKPSVFIPIVIRTPQSTHNHNNTGFIYISYTTRLKQTPILL